MNTNLFTRNSPYGWLMLAAIILSIILWTRVARRDQRLLFVYIAALVSAFLGAKLVYLAAEGWLHWRDPDRWLQFATGKSITGGLLGGYLGVEIAKRFLHYKNPTGDWFALIAPLGIMIGRVGCIMHGCCLGRVCEPAWFTMTDSAGAARWPAALVELLFNGLMLLLILLLRWRGRFPGQLFHIYLIAYGFFRFGHEFLCNTPRILGPLSGYQIAALALVALGLSGFLLRHRDRSTPKLTNPSSAEILHAPGCLGSSIGRAVDS